MEEQKPRRPYTVSRGTSATGMIEMANSCMDPLRRAQLLAEAQELLGWALASAVGECEEAKHSWAAIGQAVGMSRETVFRQFKAGGPVVTVRAVQSEKSSKLKTSADAEAIYAAQLENGTWLGSPDVLPEGEYQTAILTFNPANPEGNAFAGQILRVRVGRLDEDVSIHAAQVQMADRSEHRVRVTYELLNLLFEDGQTPLRRALTGVVHAVIGNPGVDGAFQQIVDRAANAQALSARAAAGIAGDVMPTAEFIAAVDAIIEAIPNVTPLDIHALIALRKLEKVVNEYRAWAKVTQRKDVEQP